MWVFLAPLTSFFSTVCSNTPMAWHYRGYLFRLRPPVSCIPVWFRMYALAFRGHVGACGCLAYIPSTSATRHWSLYIWVGLGMRTYLARCLFSGVPFSLPRIRKCVCVSVWDLRVCVSVCLSVCAHTFTCAFFRGYPFLDLGFDSVWVNVPSTLCGGEWEYVFFCLCVWEWVYPPGILT